MPDSNSEGCFRTVKIRASAEMPAHFSRKSLHVFAEFFTPCIFKKRSLPFCVNRLLELRWSPARTVRSPALRQGRGFFWVYPKRRTATPSQGYVVWILFQWRHYVTTLKRNTFSLGYAVLVVPFYLVIQSYWIVKILVISHT